MTDRQMTDVATLRERARRHIEQGAITESYGTDPRIVIGMLNEALATEIVCLLRYKRHYYTAQGLASDSVRNEFLEHARQEEEHADWLAARIVQLGGEPDFSPQGLAERSHAEYVAGTSLIDMIKEDLVAERVAIESYSEMIKSIGGRDVTSRRLLERILAVEEEHAEDLLSLIQGMQQGTR
ncbi:MAG: ferritin-like domain-containing protein [Burkholderiales bacterium]|nr:ferritin-like domain-containing protein [Burkholderiales bacterium]